MNERRIPFVDLAAHHAPIRSAIDRVIARVIDASAFVLGDEVERFERAFAAFVGAEHGVGTGNGLDALTLALRGLGLDPGDEVLVPVNSFIATALAVEAAQGRPVLVDCCEDTALMDLDLAAASVTPRTRAMVPVHLYGRPLDPTACREVAGAHGLAFIEDACQAHGAGAGDECCGSMGDAAAFSFDPGKNLGALGDGGMVTTSDPHRARAVRQRRSYGEETKYHHTVVGMNSRLDALQAAVLGVKLTRLAAANAARATRARWYDTHLGGVPGVMPLVPVAADTAHVFHLYVVRVADGARDDLRSHLSAEGIDTAIHYPIPMHLQPALAHLGHRRGDFPVAERLAGEILSLPMYPELEHAQAERVVDAIQTFARKRFAGVRFSARSAEDSPREALVSPGKQGRSTGGDPGA
jgi:dTDP-4-amino-4,6-dideoxygalactose transaminase